MGCVAEEVMEEGIKEETEKEGADEVGEESEGVIEEVSENATGETEEENLTLGTLEDLPETSEEGVGEFGGFGMETITPSVPNVG